MVLTFYHKILLFLLIFKKTVAQTSFCAWTNKCSHDVQSSVFHCKESGAKQTRTSDRFVHLLALANYLLYFTLFHTEQNLVFSFSTSSLPLFSIWNTEEGNPFPQRKQFLNVVYTDIYTNLSDVQ